MAPVRGARYNIRRKFDNAPAEEHDGKSKETNVQQRQELQKGKSNQTTTTAISHSFPTYPCTRTDLFYPTPNYHPHRSKA